MASTRHDSLQQRIVAIGYLAVAAAFVTMAVWTWNTWPDVLVDFGKELYIAWRLAAGDHLYRDVAYYMGPLSPWVNGLVFRLFGTGLRTLVLINLCICAGIVVGVMGVARVAAGHGAAVVCGLLVTLMFVFAEATPNGNYNYVCPYEHEYTHGLLLCLATLLALWRAIHSSKSQWYFSAGFGCGLVALTRGELLIAIGTATALGLALQRTPPRRAILFAAGCVLPPLVALVLLRLNLSWREAAVGVAGSWPSMFNHPLTSLPFYRRGMGMLDPAHSAALLLRGSVRWLLWLAPAVGASVWLKPKATSAALRTVAIATFAVYMAATAVVWKTIASTNFFRPLTLCAIGLVGISAWAWFRRREPVSVFRVSVSVFAGLLLLKMVLYARIHQYGFAVAMPVTLASSVAVGVLLPRTLDRAGRAGWVLRAAMLGAGCVVVAVHLALTSAVLATKTARVGAGADTFWADAARGPAVDQAARDLSRGTGPTQTVLVLPEGAMLNYLARRRAPTAVANFNPPDLAIFGADQILNELRAHPPEVVLLTHKDTSEFGTRFFGRDYGRLIAGWVGQNYHVVKVIGDLPLQDKSVFGIAEMEANHSPAATHVR